MTSCLTTFSISKISFTLIFSLIELKAEKVYEFNSLCQQAYKEITQLKLNNGLVLIEKAKQQNSENLIPLVLENYIDFFILFFNEDPAEYKIRNKKIEDRIAILKSGPESSPFYNFSFHRSPSFWSAFYLLRGHCFLFSDTD